MVPTKRLSIQIKGLQVIKAADQGYGFLTVHELSALDHLVHLLFTEQCSVKLRILLEMMPDCHKTTFKKRKF